MNINTKIKFFDRLLLVAVGLFAVVGISWATSTIGASIITDNIVLNPGGSITFGDATEQTTAAAGGSAQQVFLFTGETPSGSPGPRSTIWLGSQISDYEAPYAMTSAGTVSKIKVYTYGTTTTFPNGITTTLEVFKNGASFATPVLLTMNGDGATRTFGWETDGSQTFIAGDRLSFKVFSNSTYNPPGIPSMASTIELSLD